MKGYRYSNLGLLEYSIENGNVEFQGKLMPGIAVFETPEESKMDYYLKRKKELLDYQESLNKKLAKTRSDLQKLDSEFKDVIKNNPELKI